MDKYLLLKADEDGNHITLLDRQELFDLFRDPVGERSITDFSSDPALLSKCISYWPRGTAMLVHIDRIEKPKPITTAWALD